MTQEELDLLLFGAILTNNVSLVKKSIDLGADVNKRMEWSNFCVECAGNSIEIAMNSYPNVHDDIITCILEAGANVNYSDTEFTYSLLESVISRYMGSNENDEIYAQYEPHNNNVNKKQYRFLISSLLEHGASPNFTYGNKSSAESLLEAGRSFAVYETERCFFEELMFLVLRYGANMPIHPSYYKDTHSVGSALKMFSLIQSWPLLMLLYCISYKNVNLYLFGVQEEAFIQMKQPKKVKIFNDGVFLFTATF